MGTHSETLDREAQRRLAADCLQTRRGTLIEKAGTHPARNDDEMIHGATRQRVPVAGTSARQRNRARGEWQCSRVYAILGRNRAGARARAGGASSSSRRSPGEMEEFDLPGCLRGAGAGPLGSRRPRRQRALTPSSGARQRRRSPTRDDRKIMEGGTLQRSARNRFRAVRVEWLDPLDERTPSG